MYSIHLHCGFQQICLLFLSDTLPHTPNVTTMVSVLLCSSGPCKPWRCHVIRSDSAPPSLKSQTSLWVSCHFLWGQRSIIQFLFNLIEISLLWSPNAVISLTSTSQWQIVAMKFLLPLHPRFSIKCHQCGGWLRCNYVPEVLCLDHLW